jgi:DNA transformation protein and related proteins
MMISALVEHLMDVLRPLGGVAARRMFGGAGLFRDGAMFALISDEVLYLKADAATIPAFEAERLGPFTYGTKNGNRVLTSYWRAPERLLDDDDEMRAWCRRATDVAGQIPNKKRSTKSAGQSYPGGGTKPPISRSTCRLNAIAVLS